MIRPSRLAAILALLCVALLVPALDAQTTAPRKPLGKEEVRRSDKG